VSDRVLYPFFSPTSVLRPGDAVAVGYERGYGVPRDQLAEKSAPCSTAAETLDATEERALFARLKRGESDALDPIYAAYHRQLFALALRVIGRAEDAQEVMQDAMVKIWERIHAYDEAKSRPFAWAAMITRGLAIDRVRFLHRRRHVLAQPTEALPEPPVPPPGFSEDESDRLHSALSGLRPEDREMLEMSIFDDLSHGDIADRTGFPLGTVKTRLRRALARLRHSLAPFNEAPGL
jgi:RNA polymerase sigma-70 factor, ECF subfamily